MSRKPPMAPVNLFRGRAAAIAEARRRGIKTARIAFALGISHQRVVQLAPGFPRVTPNLSPTARKHHLCRSCGKPIYRKGKAEYCSGACIGRDRDNAPIEYLLRAIELRLEGYVWREIIQMLEVEYQRHRSMQNILTGVWKLLYFHGLLSERAATELCRKPAGYSGPASPAWDWLVNNTGYGPGEGAAGDVSLAFALERLRRSSMAPKFKIQRLVNN